jgi:DNA polymerase I
MATEKQLLLLFDGNALVHRAFHAMPPLTVLKTGEMVGAVYGFASMLIKAINELKPTHYAVAFDRKAPTFRHQLFEQYKAQRPATPDELVGQLGRVRQLVEAFRIPIFELDGYEADDILGALSKQASEKGIESIIVTGDADIMQLVNPHIKVFYPRPGGTFSDAILYDEAAVVNKFGVKPSQVADYKALKGDPSDNIPGVPGVGDKTATKLLQQFENVDIIYARIGEVTPPKLQDKLRENEALAMRSKELTTIVLDTPVTLDLELCCQITRYDRNRVVDLFRELGFNSLVTKLPEMETEKHPLPEIKAEAILQETRYNIIKEPAELERLLSRLKSTTSFGLFTVTTNENAISAAIAGIAISPAPSESYYIPLEYAGASQLELMPQGEIPKLPPQKILEVLKPVLEDARYAKLTHDGKSDLIALAEHGTNMSGPSFDTMLAAHILGEKSLSLRDITFGRMGIEIQTLTDLIGSGAKQVPVAKVETEKVADFACASADFILRLSELLTKELNQQDLWKLFSEVEMALVPVLADMEMTGVALDTELLGRMSTRLGEQTGELEKKIYANAGQEFNINSPMQLGVVLFEKLHLEPGRKSKGKYSTDAAVLEGLRGSDPIIDLILEYRQLIKLKSTYIDALPQLINSRTGRVHTSFNQARTATGRLSSSDPNLQNIPVRGELGREIRRAFIAPAGSILLAGDYSQIDLRALAHLSQDEGLLEAFRTDKDIHAATAAQLFGVDITNVAPDMRRLAKTVNFGVIYGMSEYGLEQATELSRAEAGKFILAYFNKYPGVKKYLENTKEQVRRTGFVQTILGRRRYIPEVNSPNRIVRESAERMAINMPVQGTSADIIKVAMVNLFREMGRRQLKSKMLLQVHDELIFEVPPQELEEMTQLVRETMCAAIKLSVPVKVDIKTGQNWGEME